MRNCNIVASAHDRDSDPAEEPQRRTYSGAISFAAIEHIIEPLIRQRPSVGAVFVCPVCRIMYSRKYAAAANPGRAEVACPNERDHPEILAAARGTPLDSPPCVSVTDKQARAAS